MDITKKKVIFNDKPCELIQVTDDLTPYKQVDGNIYEITGDSPVE